MRFYRRLQQVSALSFDLDDTLYSNQPIMQQAEQVMQAFFTEQLPQCRPYQRRFWLQHRALILQSEPMLRHDVTKLRRASYQSAIFSLTADLSLSERLAEQALTLFLQHRSNFKVSTSTQALLAQLAKKYPLIAITNGNVDAERVGIASYFRQIYHPALGFQSKPVADMFHQACQQLGIAPVKLLHVGDCGHADVMGALDAGCQAAWLSSYPVGKAIRILPHVEFSSLTELKELI
jgi:FMN hydrolase / 5-amino-6-(5-phospho-D-ribitylamino)uracil phosphatase